jgi:hypothetical protein
MQEQPAKYLREHEELAIMSNPQPLPSAFGQVPPPIGYPELSPNDSPAQSFRSRPAPLSTSSPAHRSYQVGSVLLRISKSETNYSGL